MVSVVEKKTGEKGTSIVESVLMYLDEILVESV